MLRRQSVPDSRPRPGSGARSTAPPAA